MNFIDSFFISHIPSIYSDFLNIFFTAITHLGDKYALLFILFVLIVLSVFKKFSLARLMVFFASIAGALVTSTLLKYLIERARPVNGLIIETGYSFPSNHATMAMVTYGLCVYFIVRSNISSCVKRLSSVLFIILILLIGFSRMYLGVHFFTDVIAGYLVGGVFLALGIWADKRLSKN